MMLRRIGCLAMLVVASLARPVLAQDDPRIGIAMGYPASVGLIWHVADGVALRPEISFTRSSAETTITTSLPVITVGGVPTINPATTVTVNTTDQWEVGVGVSALFYVTRHDALRTYLSPRYAYTRRSSTNQASTLLPSTAFGSDSSGHFVSGSFGAQYALGRRFSVFGEVGLGYSRSESKPPALSSGIITGAATSHTLSTRSGAGVVLYF
jgi:hypothetical protein